MLKQRQGVSWQPRSLNQPKCVCLCACVCTCPRRNIRLTVYRCRREQMVLAIRPVNTDHTRQTPLTEGWHFSVGPLTSTASFFFCLWKKGGLFYPKEKLISPQLNTHSHIRCQRSLHQRPVHFFFPCQFTRTHQGLYLITFPLNETFP